MMKAPIPLEKIKKEYASSECHPIKQYLFRAFRLCPIDKVSVVILGGDPYYNVHNDEPSACGLAFATQNGYENGTSRMIIKEIQSKIPYAVTHSPKDFMKWCAQGVLLLNTALSVRDQESKSHGLIWKPFTEYTITKLSKQNPEIVWLLMGNDAHQYQNLLWGGTVVKTPHPAAEIHSGNHSRFLGSNCFKKINDHLCKLNKEKIQW